MDFKKFYKNHPVLSNYLISVPLFTVLLTLHDFLFMGTIGLFNLVQVFITSFIALVPVAIGNFTAIKCTKNFDEGRDKEIFFIVSWILIANALPIVNLIFAESQEMLADSILMIAVVSIVVGIGYLISRKIKKKK